MKPYVLFWLILAPLAVRSQEALRVQNGAVLAIQNGATLTISGGLTLDNGSTLIHNGTITLGGTGTADLTDNTTTPYSYGAGTTIFSSSTPQTLNSPNTFGQITVQNAGLELAGNITATSWQLISGVVNTNGHLAITTSSVTGALTPGTGNPGFANSWINGTIRRYISPAAVDSYDFPIGSATQSNQVTITNLTAAPLVGTTYIDATFTPKPGTDDGLIVSENGTPYIFVNSAGVWHLTPDAEPTAGKYDLILYLGGFTGLTDNQFAPLERPDASSNAADWIVPANSTLPAENTAGRTVAGGYAQRNDLTAFSQWGVGMTSTPLPIILAGFNAIRISKEEVALNWQTAMEENNKGFGIERKLDDDTAFSFVGFVGSEAPGGNSSQPLSYQYTDTNSYPGTSYYRLRQEDLDGHSTYSAIKAVSGDNGGLTVSLYPNPGHGQFTLRIDGSDGRYSAVIADLLGHTIRRIEATGNTSVQITGLAPGIYVVQILGIFGNGRSFVQKVWIIP